MDYAFGITDQRILALRSRSAGRLVRSLVEPTRRLCVLWPAKGGRGAQVDRAVSGQKTEEYVRLVQAIGRGDARAEAELVRRFSRAVLFKLRRITQDPVLADDLHQDTFQKVLEKLRSGDVHSPESLPSYIRNTAHNLAIEHYRKARRRGENPDSDMIDRIRDESRGPFRCLSDVQRSAVVRQLVEDLTTERDRDIIKRFYFLGQSKARLCILWDLSTEHFDRVTSRARHRLKQIILLKYPHIIDRDDNDDDE